MAVEACKYFMEKKKVCGVPVTGHVIPHVHPEMCDGG